MAYGTLIRKIHMSCPLCDKTHEIEERERKLARLKDVPAIVKTDLSEEEAYMYVIETNLMQRLFSDLLISEKAAVLRARYEKGSCQGKCNDSVREIAKLEGKLTTRDSIGKE